jgi:hypothetical protein
VNKQGADSLLGVQMTSFSHNQSPVGAHWGHICGWDGQVFLEMCEQSLKVLYTHLRLLPYFGAVVGFMNKSTSTNPHQASTVA